MEIQVGCDPEVFVTKGGKPFSAHGLVQGTKSKPQTVDDGAVQVDGMALEYNTKPAKTAEAFVHNNQSVLRQLQSMIPADCRIEIVPSIVFDKGHLAEQPAEALALGCDPDYDAYTGWMNPKPDGSGDMRTAAGHIHIGWTSDEDPLSIKHFEMCKQLVIQLDHYLGLPSLVLDPDKRRRSMYGKAGCFRPKSYGCEYRVLSNFWIKSPELMKWAFDNTLLAVRLLLEDKPAMARMNAQNYARNAINVGDISHFTANVYKNPDVGILWEEIRETFKHLVPAA